MNEDFLFEAIDSIKGIGDKTKAAFNKAGIYYIKDLLAYYPRNYDTFEEILPSSAAKAGNVSAFRLRISSEITVRHVKNMSILTFEGADNEGVLNITFFNQPYLKSSLKRGGWYIFRGLVKTKGRKLVLQQPSIYKQEDYAALEGTMQPIYPLVSGLTNNMVKKAMKIAIEYVSYMKDTLPAELKQRHELMEYSAALKDIHFPKNRDSFDMARKRLAYDEYLLFILKLKLLKLSGSPALPKAVIRPSEITDRLSDSLPYKLTTAQKRVLSEIRRDMSSGRVMNRLIQGDVGCGKTILAFMAMLDTVSMGLQAALMAPTEVLARQHYEDMLEMTKKYDLPFKPVFLAGSVTAAQKKKIRKSIISGEVNVIIGTNALIQDAVEYKDLALVITDEQHRFGVRQRERFADKGEKCHVLAMSATPIPRTLAIILYGDLDVSVVDEKPGERLPVKNCVVDTSYRPTAYNFIKKQVALGRQVYVICPMIEEGEMNDVENVTDYTAKLSQILPDLKIAMLNGKMKAAEKDRIMEDFALHNIDVLVSTTVIEVGVNVPNATVMMIENAQHFGLAQLHQLRGRVGRGSEQSYCIFINSSEGEEAAKRLDILAKSNDGFVIAEEDLKQRGPGELFGIRQSGELSFKAGDIYADSDLIRQAAADAAKILESDPDLSNKEHSLMRKEVYLPVMERDVTL
ncbi:ATP-dependent DNA helicase RecG [Butyrivibrio sp. MC2013]|uniref:ATP-dependent DNA helicase RecG n=1 Tax=Butyrivibrio sp. MC2013 TaxID=1280686 RepID=UPI00042A0211|nr:ATP-dependent DNA helicase RecG [Butyrivibrio sp. MC2013]